MLRSVLHSRAVDFLRQWIGVLLILAGLARAGAVILQDPMVGYANQSDMHGTSACVGLFPAADPASRAPTADAPISRYALGARTDGCYLSAEVGISATAVALARATGVDATRFRLQWVGYVKLALLFGAAFLIAWLLRDHPAASAFHGLVVLLVLADPVVTLWMNTLYQEFALVWSLYLVMAAGCVLALYDRQSLLTWALLVMGLVVLAVARAEYALLAPVLFIAAWPWLWHSSHRLTTAAAVITIAAMGVGLFVLPKPLQVAKGDRTDTYLQLIVPASSSTIRGLGTLGLPDTCEPLVGASWQRQRGESVEKSCPQVYALSGFSLVRFAADEPAGFARAAARLMPAAQGIAPTYLGTLEGQRGKTIDDLPWWGFSPIRAMDALLPAPVFVAMTLATWMLAPAGLVALLVLRRWRGDPLAPLLLAMLLGLTAIYSFVATMAGGGLTEAARHYLPGSLATYVALLGVIAAIPVLALRWKETPKESLLELGVGLAVIVLAAYAGFVAVDWASSQPRAVGSLETPAVREVPAGGTLALRGWAVDPSGVEAVRVRVGNVVRTARLGEPATAKGLFSVANVYAGYPGAATAAFALDLTREELTQAGAPNPLTLRVEVQGRNGASTEVDRRNLVFQGSDPIQAPRQ
ncbi:MAG TPA: hypothetical protein VM051_04285 [Usitatibacter sp.]|nr:hypothetical protein [Usitatibacter sp.]